jgi:hypothetical protein
VLTLAAVAEHKKISPEHIEVSVRRETVEQDRWDTSFFVRLDLGGGLTTRERTILFNSARQCDVRKLLIGVLHFDYGWMD